VLDPPLVHQQLVQYPAVGEVPHQGPPEGGIAVGVLALVVLLGWEVFLPGVHRVEGRRLESLGPLEPPGQTHDPLSQIRLHLAGRLQFRQPPLAVAFELARVFPVDKDLPAAEPMLDGVLRDDGLALGRAGPRGFPCVGTIGKNLRLRSHEPALRIEKGSTIDYQRFTVSLAVSHQVLRTYHTHPILRLQ